MEFPVAAIAALLGGELTDPSRAGWIVKGVNSLSAAGKEDLAFLWDAAYAEQAQGTQAAVLVTAQAIEGVACLVVKDPQAAMLTILNQVYELRHPAPGAGIDPTASVHPSAQVAEDAYVGPLAVVGAQSMIGPRARVLARAYVGNAVQLAEDVVVHPNATLLDHVQVGARSVIWSGAVVGKDGFGFLPKSGDRRDLSQGSQRIPQVGGVVIGADVEIGALTTVARGALEDTLIEDGVIVDDQVHVAHGCRVGRNTVIVGRTALAGSATIGANAYLLQASAVGQGRTVGERAVLGSGAQVLYKDVEPGQEVLGWPARPATKTRRLWVLLDKLVTQLPDLRKRVKALEKASGAGS